MLNSHQILAGARTKGGIKTYVGAEYVGVPTAVANGGTDGVDITNTDGVVSVFYVVLSEEQGLVEREG